MMGRYTIILLSLLLMLALPAAVAAQTVTINGVSEGEINVVQGGDVIIAINNLVNDVIFRLDISSVAPHLSPSGLKLYRLDSFVMPFTLQTGVFNAQGTNLNYMKYEAKKGDTIAGIQENADGNKKVSITETRDWNKGTYDYIEVTGEVADSNQKVSVVFNVSGITKQAAGNHTLTFAIKGANDGKVNVKVTIGGGNPKANVTINIQSTTLPEAAFTGTPTSGTAPLEVKYTDQSTGNVNQWKWEFGDGREATTKNPITTYRTSGTYNVKLTVWNAAGSNSLTKTAYITVNQPNPVASFTADKTDGNADLAVQFTDTSSGSPDTWAWTFGDGGASNAQNPAHTYTTAGTYTASLTASRSGGPTSTTTKQITVRPVAAFTADTNRGNAPLNVQFTDQSTGNPAAFAWTFGDGGTSNAQNPAHNYAAAGTYTVALTVTGGGLTNTNTKTAFVTAVNPVDPPVAAFRANTTNDYAALAVQFTDLSAGGADAWEWNFGDGSTSIQPNPTHTYTTAGTYTVTLTAKKTGAASSTETKAGYITVQNPTPVASFTTDKTRGEVPVAVQFTDTSTGKPNFNYNWNFGDGTTSTLQNPTHVFNHNEEGAKTYTVTLTTTNADGTSTATTSIIAVSPPQKEDVSDRINTTSGAAKEEIKLDYQNIEVKIPANTVAKDANNNPIVNLTVGVASDVTNPPAGSSIKVGDKVFVLGPAGATFNPAIPVTIGPFTVAEWDELFGGGRNTQIKRYDGTNWIALTDQTRDDNARTITGFTTGYSTFGPITTDPSPAPPQPSGGGGGGGGTSAAQVTPVPPTVTSIETTTLAVDATGALANTYLVETPTESAELRLPAGTVAQDAAGNALSSVSINDIPSENVPSAPAGAVYSFAGSAIIGSPAGATFNPAISLTFRLTPEQIQHIDSTGEVPTVQRYNAVAGEWEFIPTTYNLVSGTVTGQVDHFSIFAVFYMPPTIEVVEPTPVSTPPTTAPVTPEEPAPFPWTYVIIGVIIIILIAGGAYYYTQQKS